MAEQYALKFDVAEERLYETGVDHCVFYQYTTENGYNNGEVWNGVSQISDNPEGGESNPIYADNIKYLNLISAENLKYTIQAYSYPETFDEYNGARNLIAGVSGVTIRQQTRKTFGFCYRTKVGNSVVGEDYGYKLHLVYGCTAAPSSKDYSTTNENPDAAQFSWDIDTIPVDVPGFKPTACIEIDSTKFTNSNKLNALLQILYGTPAVEAAEGSEGVAEIPARMPLPSEIITLLGEESAGEDD